jgi:hypothetical protein
LLLLNHSSFPVGHFGSGAFKKKAHGENMDTGKNLIKYKPIEYR